MTITAMLELSILADQVAQAPAILREILTATRAFPGNLGVLVLEDSADPAHLVIVETWESLEADTAYRAWRAGEGASPLGALLAGPPTVTKFTTQLEL